MRYLLTSMVIILGLLLSPLAGASVCSVLANQIQNDITSNKNNFSHKHLPWMDLAWLQSKLGKTAATIVDNKKQYQWQCPGSSGSYIAAEVDPTGIINEVKGQYSSAESSGQFSACLGLACDDQPIPVVTQLPVNPASSSIIVPASTVSATTSSAESTAGPAAVPTAVPTAVPAAVPTISPTAAAPVVPSTTAPVPANRDAACAQVADQISNASQSQGTSAVFQWESRAWLDQNLGSSTLQDTPKGKASIWSCSPTTKTAVLYIDAKEGAMLASIICDAATQCHISYALRVGGIMKGMSMQVSGSGM